jgi:ATPase subunit of ABC transporter with duplicated ATPase domains
MLTVTQLEKNYGGQTLFRDVSLQFNAGCRYGVVGANGSGKSTFLRILMGDEEPSAGEVSLPRRANIGVLSQDHFQYEDVAIIDVVLMGHVELWEAMVAKEALLAKAHEHFDATGFARLEDVIEKNDGYAMEARAAEILEGLNIRTEQHREPLSVLSGGFKLRVLLAQTLASNPDILLLDEPTNHLDILSIRWLETFLTEFRGCVMVVSHDHRFLNNVSTHIADVDYERVTLYTGNYTVFEEQKRSHRERQEAEIGKREKEIADHRVFIDRFKAKATKARQAQSRVKRMEKIVIEKLAPSSRRYPKFAFELIRPSGKDVLQVDNVFFQYGEDPPVLEEVSLALDRGDRMAVIGPNGIGKSTLLKIAMGELTPLLGEVEWGYEAHPGYFAQDHHDILTNGRDTVESALWSEVPNMPIGKIRGKLAEVLFQKDDVEKRVETLSGGESARLVFSMVGVKKPNVLVLDEPTNHLDLEGIAALAKGLQSYEGTVLFVSHDRWFVSAVATRILEIRPDGIEDFRGSFDEYIAWTADDHLDVAAVAEKAKNEKRAKKKSKKEGKR